MKSIKNYIDGFEESPECDEYKLELNPKRTDIAIITSGLGKNYYLENLEDYKSLCEARFPGKGVPSTLHIGTLPLPAESIKKLAANVEQILVIEEGMPFVEKQLRGVLPQKVKIIGKFTGELPRAGELNPDNVRTALGLPQVNSVASEFVGKNSVLTDMCENLAGRPPQLCKGCPHGDSYTAINLAVKSMAEKDGQDNVAVLADIGCYALGAVPPYNAVESIVCMGASIGMARGASLAGIKNTIGVLGLVLKLKTGNRI